MKSQICFLAFSIVFTSATLARTNAAPAQASANTSAAATAAEAARPELLVSTQWLADHLSDPKLVLVQVGGNAADYHAQHIPGARLLPNDKLVDQKPPGTELLPVDQLKKNLEEIGINDSSHVVFYADWDPMATRLFFTLDYLGFAGTASLLDGSMEQWVAEKRPVSAEDPKITSGTLTVKLHPEIVAKMDWMSKLISSGGSDSSVAIVDSRPLRRYRNGHLAGSTPMFWETALISQEKPLLRSPRELRKMLADRGITPGKKIVSYCEVGWQATYTYFLARYLGYDAAMYDGSYNEWSTAKQPVVRGDSAR
jgi:thiosulfate/3-mercaptopyruvate sulfurtransferase